MKTEARQMLYLERFFLTGKTGIDKGGNRSFPAVLSVFLTLGLETAAMWVNALGEGWLLLQLLSCTMQRIYYSRWAMSTIRIGS